MHTDSSRHRPRIFWPSSWPRNCWPRRVAKLAEHIVELPAKLAAGPPAAAHPAVAAQAAELLDELAARVSGKARRSGRRPPSASMLAQRPRTDCGAARRGSDRSVCDATFQMLTASGKRAGLKILAELFAVRWSVAAQTRKAEARGARACRRQGGSEVLKRVDPSADSRSHARLLARHANDSEVGFACSAASLKRHGGRARA